MDRHEAAKRRARRCRLVAMALAIFALTVGGSLLSALLALWGVA